MYAILDAQPVAHLGFVRDGSPVVIPTLQWRDGDWLYWHGSSGSTALLAADGADVCVTVTLVDGLVLARSGLHHSMNYRCAMVFGTATAVTDEAVKERLLNGLIDSLIPQRSELLRPMTAKELRSTCVQGMPIEEASAKQRAGGVADEPEDYDLPIWAGVLPLSMTTASPLADPQNRVDVEMPPGTERFRIG